MYTGNESAFMFFTELHQMRSLRYLNCFQVNTHTNLHKSEKQQKSTTYFLLMLDTKCDNKKIKIKGLHLHDLHVLKSIELKVVLILLVCRFNFTLYDENKLLSSKDLRNFSYICWDLDCQSYTERLQGCYTDSPCKCASNGFFFKEEKN